MLIQLDLRPGRRELRQFGWIALVAFGLLGAVILWKGGLFHLSFGAAGRPVAFTLWAVGAASALLSIAWPQGNRPLFVGLSLLAFPIGWVVSHLVLAILFYGVLTPVGLLFRVLGRDPLERPFQSEMRSYWVDLREVTDEKDYFRQF
jgi:hypothetical protein